MQNILNIIEKASKGDKAAFGQLVSQHQQYAFNLAFRIVCNENDAMDIEQDCFIKIWKNMNKYNPKIKFTTWMYKIVTNAAIDFLRASKKMKLVSLENLNLSQVNNDQPDVQMSNKELGQMIEVITNTLSEKQKMVFTLRDLQGLKSEEVCEISGFSATVVKSNLYHARKMVRKKLQKIINVKGGINEL